MHGGCLFQGHEGNIVRTIVRHGFAAESARRGRHDYGAPDAVPLNTARLLPRTGVAIEYKSGGTFRRFEGTEGNTSSSC